MIISHSKLNLCLFTKTNKKDKLIEYFRRKKLKHFLVDNRWYIVANRTNIELSFSCDKMNLLYEIHWAWRYSRVLRDDFSKFHNKSVRSEFKIWINLERKQQIDYSSSSMLNSNPIMSLFDSTFFHISTKMSKCWSLSKE